MTRAECEPAHTLRSVEVCLEVQTLVEVMRRLWTRTEVWSSTKRRNATQRGEGGGGRVVTDLKAGPTVCLLEWSF